MSTENGLTMCISPSEKNSNGENSPVDQKPEATDLSLTKCIYTEDMKIDPKSETDIDSISAPNELITPALLPNDSSSTMQTPSSSEALSMPSSSSSPMIHPTVTQTPLLGTNFSLPTVNPLLASTLASPFLAPNLFLNPHISSPVLETVFRNTWIR